MAKTPSISHSPLSETAQRLMQRWQDFQDDLNDTDWDDAQEDENVWDVWPYNWAIDGWNSSRDRFHSFHGKLKGVMVNVKPRRISSPVSCASGESQPQRVLRA